MLRPLTSLILICTLLLTGATPLAANKQPQRQKSRVERKGSNSSARAEEAREKRESRKEAAARREAIKRNPRAAALFKGGNTDLDGERFDQPQEAVGGHRK